jgi:hypothetical protein
MRGRLTLTVHRGEQLKQSHLLGRLAPYIKLTIGQQSFKTLNGADPINPSYNQSFTFDLDDSQAEPTLQLQVKDHSLLGARQLAHADIPLRDVLTFAQQTRINVIGSDNIEPCGSVIISTAFTPLNDSPQPAAADAKPAPAMPTVSSPVYPQLSPPPAYNPAFAHPPDEPPPPYQFAGSAGSAAGTQPPIPAQPIVMQPTGPSPPPQHTRPAPQAFQSWPPAGGQPVASPTAAPVMQAAPASPSVVMLPPFETEVKDGRHVHRLRHRRAVYNGEYQCNVCRRERRGPVFHCEIDNFDLCPDCFINPIAGRVLLAPSGVPVAPHRDYRHPHPLLWQPVYQNTPSGQFQCDGCGRTGSGMAWHCDACNYDLHSQCLRPTG